VPKGQRTLVAAAIPQAFLQPDAEAARHTWRHVADQLRPRWPKLAALMDDSEHDVLAYMTFSPGTAPSCTVPTRLARLNKEVKRRADVVSIRPASPG
jgi:putative transposase